MSLDDEGREMNLEARRREERRAVDEAGGGESEGFELADEDLIEHASHGDEHGTAKITEDAGSLDEEFSDVDYGESDRERPQDG
jgi:hypothetical protein